MEDIQSEKQEFMECGARCTECPLLEARYAKQRWGYKNNTGHKGPVDIVFVGEGPATVEIARGEFFVGPSGDMLQSFLNPLQYGTAWITNTAMCFTKDEKEKVQAAICCRDRLIADVCSKDPRLIVTLGNIPTDMLLGKGDGITKRRGILHKAKLNGKEYSVLPTVLPAAVLRFRPRWFPDFSADMRKAKSILLNGPVSVEARRDPYVYELTGDYAHVLREAEKGMYSVLDMETHGLGYNDNLPFLMVVTTPINTFLLPEWVLFDMNFQKALAECKAKWVGHNAKFDRNVVKQHLGVSLKFSMDTLLVDYLFDERTTAAIHDLKGIASRIWNVPRWDDDLEIELDRVKKEHKVTDYSLVDRDLLHRYAAMDGYYTWKLAEYESKRLVGNSKFVWLFKNVLMPALHALSDAETRGVMIDRPRLRDTMRAYEREAADLERELCQIIGVEYKEDSSNFNPRSTKQVAHILYDVMGFMEIRGQGRSTNADNVLVKLPQVPFVTTLMEYRVVHKLLSTYLAGIQDKLDHSGFLHTTYNLAGTTTGRLSSSDPNLQNQPSRGSRANDVKGLFVARPGCVMIDADYSQIELRMLAYLSQDPFLVEVYREGRDLHGEMAAKLFGQGYTKDQRSLAKTLNFMVGYGGSDRAVADMAQFSLSRHEAKVLLEEFYATMPGIVSLKKEVEDFVRAYGYVESPTGRRRRFPHVLNGNLPAKEFAEVMREAFNHPPQSGAAETTLMAYVELWKLGITPILTVYDSIVTEVPEEIAEDCQRKQIEIMERAWYELYGDSVPIAVDSHIVKRWSGE